MSRRSDPAVRRQQLVEAAFKTIAERGNAATRLSDIAERAGVAPSLVSYYFPSRDDLLLEATRFGVDRFFAERAAALARVEDPLERLEQAIRWAVPDGSRDPDWIVLMEFWTHAIRRTSLQTVAAVFQSRARTLYVSIIESGRASGRFAPSAPSEAIAASIIGMIHGLAMRVILVDPVIDADALEGLVLDYARLAVGAPAREVIG